MRFGYACINTMTKNGFRTCRLATAQKEGIDKVKKITIWNIKHVLENLEWNVQNNIFFYRMTSNIVPFATHPHIVEDLKWKWENDSDILEEVYKVNKFVKENNVRLTLHPGQHSPLNTPNENVLYNVFLDFEYHDKLLSLMGGNDMITHVGGVYGDKERAKERFISHYSLLNDSIKMRLRLENDDKSFNIKDVLDIHIRCGVPICLDIHHHNCNPSEGDIKDLIPEVMNSWNGYGTPKTHISTGKTGRLDRSHHNYVSREDLMEFLDVLNGSDVDIMFESKSKEQSVLRLIDLQN